MGKERKNYAGLNSYEDDNISSKPLETISPELRYRITGFNTDGALKPLTPETIEHLTKAFHAHRELISKLRANDPKYDVFRRKYLKFETQDSNNAFITAKKSNKGFGRGIVINHLLTENNNETKNNNNNKSKFDYDENVNQYTNDNNNHETENQSKTKEEIENISEKLADLGIKLTDEDDIEEDDSPINNPQPIPSSSLSSSSSSSSSSPQPQPQPQSAQLTTTNIQEKQINELENNDHQKEDNFKFSNCNLNKSKSHSQSTIDLILNNYEKKKKMKLNLTGLNDIVNVSTSKNSNDQNSIKSDNNNNNNKTRIRSFYSEHHHHHYHHCYHQLPNTYQTSANQSLVSYGLPSTFYYTPQLQPQMNSIQPQIQYNNAYNDNYNPTNSFYSSTRYPTNQNYYEQLNSYYNFQSQPYTHNNNYK